MYVLLLLLLLLYYYYYYYIIIIIIICLRGSRARRKAFCDFKNIDIDAETQEGAIM